MATRARAAAGPGFATAATALTVTTGVWTDERVRLLYRLHAQIGHRARAGWRPVMATRLGVSLSALVAKLGREYAAHRLTPVAPMPRRAPAREIPPVAPPAPDFAAAHAEAEAARAAMRAELGPGPDLAMPLPPVTHGCQWPARPAREETGQVVELRQVVTRRDNGQRDHAGQDKGALVFCGRPIATPGVSWCPLHCIACWGPDWDLRRAERRRARARLAV